MWLHYVSNLVLMELAKVFGSLHHCLRLVVGKYTIKVKGNSQAPIVFVINDCRVQYLTGRELGAKALDEEEARINQLMVKQARKVIVVADSSKLTARAFARICPLSAVDCFITDSGAPAEAIDKIRENGVEVIVV